MMDWKDWIGKRVYILTLTNRKYSGEVKEVTQSNIGGSYYLKIMDKFSRSVTFLTSEIAVIQEEV